MNCQKPFLLKQTSSLLRLVIIALISISLSACFATVHAPAKKLIKSDGPPRILMMPMDIALYEETAGGLKQPMAEWTDKARKNTKKIIPELLQKHNAKPIESGLVLGLPNIDPNIVQLVKLQNVVAERIRWNLIIPLPTKEKNQPGRWVRRC